MLFNSFEFFLFFPIVTSLYFLFPHAWRWSLLLTASCAFYMAFIPKYILILLITIVVDYSAGILIERTPAGKLRRFYFITSLIVTVAILAFFKYFNFLNNNVAQLARVLHWNYGVESLTIILPIGLSFHTFQSMSYVIEVYRGNQRAERHFGIYALYVMFYPQLVAGPIERPQNLLPQLREQHAFNYERVTGGLKRMAFGLFKKVVIADALANVVDQVYNNLPEYTGYPLLIATICFAWQIYCDFSGYSDIALGSAQVMGFRLMENFDRPYRARSVAEFWQRWHMSLTTWFRDYVYIPLGGNRVSAGKWYANLFVTFLISGLWHGANWTFVIWGGLNSAYLILSSWTAPLRNAVTDRIGITAYPRFHHALQMIITFSLICFAWIFFRAGSVQDALYVVSHLFDDLLGMSRRGRFAIDGFILFFILFMEYIHYIHRNGGMGNLFAEKRPAFRWAMYYALVICTVLFGSYSQQRFIYFQF
jgi:D-alanyl-lipoteichoic acid acyltransferase DltB (MBOAT superfamily)